MNQQLDVYLIRHTKPLVESGTCYGQLDCDVAEGYVEQLSIIKDYLHDKKITAIYSSPLRRCSLLAEDLARDYISNPVIYQEGLKEIDFGEWEGIQWNVIPRDKIDEWNTNRLNFQFPNGETPLKFHHRVLKTWSDNIALPSCSDEPKVILVVAHAGVIRSILCHCLHIPFQHSTQLNIDYGGISLLKVHSHGVDCRMINGA